MPAELEADAEKVRQRWAEAAARSPWFGADRPQIPAALGGAAEGLTGEMAGDYGWDPLRLWHRAQPGQRAWLREAELLHARWAMLAVVGCVVPEALAVAGVDLGEPVWWKVRLERSCCHAPLALDASRRNHERYHRHRRG